RAVTTRRRRMPRPRPPRRRKSGKPGGTTDAWVESSGQGSGHGERGSGDRPNGVRRSCERGPEIARRGSGGRRTGSGGCREAKEAPPDPDLRPPEPKLRPPDLCRPISRASRPDRPSRKRYRPTPFARPRTSDTLARERSGVAMDPENGVLEEALEHALA